MAGTSKRSSKPQSPPNATGKTTASKKPRKPSSPRVSAKSVRLALKTHGGNVSAVADAFDVTRQTIYNWIERYKLRDMVELSRDQMFATAEANIHLAVQAGNLDASRFVLTHMPVEGRWTSRSEVTGKDGAPLTLSSDVVAIMAELGVSGAEAVQEFEAMMRELAAEKAASRE